MTPSTAKTELARLEKLHKQFLKDWSEDDTDTRKELSRVISQEIIDGDSFHVPPTGDLVEMVVDELEKLRAQPKGG